MVEVTDKRGILVYGGAPGDDNLVRANADYERGTAAILTYTFVEPADLPPVKSLPYNAYSVQTFLPSERAAFRAATEVYERNAGLTFVEVENPALANISVFGVQGSEWGGWAGYVWASPYNIGQVELVMDLTTKGGLFRAGDTETLLHEIGHTVGLEHPFDGQFTLRPDLDYSLNTVMSYENSTTPNTTLGPLDRAALTHLYGPAQDTSDWRFTEMSGGLKIMGGKGDDEILGVVGENRIFGKGGDDRLMGRYGDDRLSGNGGDDKAWGGMGEDRLIGAAGRDKLYGGDGDDVLAGGRDRDVLSGGWGNDRLNGSAGNDRLTGGDGADVFIITRSGRGDVETITDFNRSEGDTLQLRFARGVDIGDAEVRGFGGGKHTRLVFEEDDVTIRLMNVTADELFF